MTFQQALIKAGDGSVWRSSNPGKRYRTSCSLEAIPMLDLRADDWYGAGPDSLERTAERIELLGKLEDAEKSAKEWQSRFEGVDSASSALALRNIKLSDRVTELEKLIENAYMDSIGMKETKKVDAAAKQS